ncbi:MAG: hypothetical protein JW910_12920, partial [Anaerolineae bacterium]|nr:hypothetical protein [Anaerolineae bacterium]
MAADFKSHVLRRDEKGFMGIPFKRLLLGGVSGGMTLVCTRFLVGHLAVVLALVVCLLALALTGLRGGLPLWQRMLYRLRGSLMLATARHPHSLSGRLGTALDVPADLVKLDAEVVFAPPEQEYQAD